MQGELQSVWPSLTPPWKAGNLSYFTLLYFFLSHYLSVYSPAKILNTLCDMRRLHTAYLHVKDCSISQYVNFIPVEFQCQDFRWFDNFLLKQFSVQIGK